MNSDQTRRDVPGNDNGAVLVIVLVFVAVVALVMGAILEQTRVSIGNTVVVRNQQALTFAADSGIEAAINRLRRDPTLCPAATGTPTTLPPLTSNGREVVMTCETVEGQSTGVLGHAVITLDDTGDSLTTSGGGDKTIQGPVWSQRLDDNNQTTLSDLVVSGGDVTEAFPNCSLGDTAPNGLTFRPVGANDYECSDDGPPSFSPTLPDVVPGSAPAPSVVGDCTTFQPGRYAPAGSQLVTDGDAMAWPASLTDENYFTSGVYLFEDISIAIGNGQVVVAGARGTDEDDVLGLDACANDSAAPGTVGSGVKWLFGGSSSISIDSDGGALEAFGRQDGAAGEGTEGVTIMQVPAQSGWSASTLGPSQDVITMQPGNNPRVAVHGITYVPTARLHFDNVAGGSVGYFQGGVVVGRLHLQSSGDEVFVSINTSESPRVIRITASAVQDAGDKAIVATAVVRFANDERRSFDVLSWRSTN